MKVQGLFGRWVVFSTLLWLGLTQESTQNSGEVIEITHNVQRIVEEIIDENDEDEDENEDDDDLEDYDYPHENVDPRNRELFAREPYRRYRKFQQGWKHHPLYVIILGGWVIRRERKCAVQAKTVESRWADPALAIGPDSLCSSWFL